MKNIELQKRIDSIIHFIDEAITDIDCGMPEIIIIGELGHALELIEQLRTDLLKKDV